MSCMFDQRVISPLNRLRLKEVKISTYTQKRLDKNQKNQIMWHNLVFPFFCLINHLTTLSRDPLKGPDPWVGNRY